MTSITQRTLTISAGKRAAIKLDQPTWQAVEWLAGQRGQTWQEWCRNILVNVNEDDNMTATIREAAMADLLGSTVFADRAEQLALMSNHPIMRTSAALDEAMLNAILQRANIQGRSDFGGFEVLFGFDEHGTDCIWIKNGLRDSLHFAILAPAN